MSVFTPSPHRLSPIYNKHTHTKNPQGFTIVELLIVIVVIAILAAISIVSYNGIQARARNTARLTMAENTIKLLELYKATYGDYPTLEAGKGYCVGTGYPNGKCRDTGSSGNGYLETDTTLSDELKKVGTIPTGNYSELSGTVGPFIRAYSSPNRFELTVLLDKSVVSSCPSIAPNAQWISSSDNRMFCVKTYYYS